MEIVREKPDVGYCRPSQGELDAVHVIFRQLEPDGKKSGCRNFLYQAEQMLIVND
jgi:hypothetical protein